MSATRGALPGIARWPSLGFSARSDSDPSFHRIIRRRLTALYPSMKSFGSRPRLVGVEGLPDT